MTTEDTPIETAGDELVMTHQPTLPTIELPEYHGRKPVGMKTALAGAGTRVTRPHTIGDRIVLVIEARVKKASHEDTDDGLVYAESLKVLDLFELDSNQGARLLSTVRSLYRSAEDAVKGRRPLPDLGETGYTDGSGVVLTPDEVAELRGDPVRAILSPDLQPAVIVLDDGARDLWPDDYPKDTPRPKLGDRLTDADGNVVFVVRLLHHETGEELEAPAALVDDDPEPFPTASPAPARGELPELPDAAAPATDEDADPYAGDLGDTVADEWDTPDPRTPEQIAEDLKSAEIEALLPTSVDFAFVDRSIDDVTISLRSVDDVTHARRILRAEEQGRGRGLKPRAGALLAIRGRIAQLEAEAGE